MKGSSTLRFVCAGVTLLAIGCSTPTGHGESLRAAMRAQTASPPKKQTGAIEGLDSQEAAIIADSYRRSLAPKGEKVADDSVILVAPSSASARQQPLAPSVPKER